MGFQGVYSLVCLPIQQIILRSTHSHPVTASLANLSARVLLASVRDKGHCLCPRCKIIKAQVADIGTHNDTRQHLKHACQDNHAQHHKIALARSFIYKKGLGITSKAVEALFKEKSLMPTVVSTTIGLSHISVLTSPMAECLFRPPVCNGISTVPDVCSRFLT